MHYDVVLNEITEQVLDGIYQTHNKAFNYVSMHRMCIKRINNVFNNNRTILHNYQIISLHSAWNLTGDIFRRAHRCELYSGIYLRGFCSRDTLSLHSLTLLSQLHKKCTSLETICSVCAFLQCRFTGRCEIMNLLPWLAYRCESRHVTEVRPGPATALAVLCGGLPTRSHHGPLLLIMLGSYS